MAVNIEKFPFKLMPLIIGFLEKQNSERLKSFRVAQAISACVPDTIETARMLNFISHYGKISSNDNGDYFLNHSNIENLPEKKFRFNYIEKLADILNLLIDKSLNINDLAEKLSRDKHEIEKDIKFLELITSKGFICLDGIKFSPILYLVPWNQLYNQ